MQTINLVVILLTVSSYALANRDDAWNRWKKEHNKVYNGLDENSRKSQWEHNLDTIGHHNRRYDLGLESYNMGLNQFSDLTYAEFKKVYLSDMQSIKLQASNDMVPSVSVTKLASAPDSIDWRTRGAVTHVKDQGECGSCWAFSTVGTLEGQYFLKNKQSAEFSEQQLVDCTSDYGCYGCGGGLMENAYEYVTKFGIETESQYPYYARDMKCQYEARKAVVKVAGKRTVHSGNEDDLKTLVGLYGPAAVAIDVEASFQHYRSGIYEDKNCSRDQLNHAVLAVGFGTERGKDFWIVKNSWGSRFGESGYIRMARNTYGACGIASMASVPTIGA